MPTVKRQKLSFPKIQPNPVSVNYEFKRNPSKNIAINDVFENKDCKAESHIAFCQISSLAEINDKSARDSSHCFVEEGFGKINNVDLSKDHVEEAVIVAIDAMIPVLIGQSNESICEEFKLRKGKLWQILGSLSSMIVASCEIL